MSFAINCNATSVLAFETARKPTKDPIAAQHYGLMLIFLMTDN